MKTLTRISVLAVLLSHGMNSNVVAQAQVDPASLAAGAVADGSAQAIGAALVSMTGVVDDLIETAGNEGNYVIFQAANQLKMLLESFRLASNGVVDKTFDELEMAQQAMFENLTKQIVLLQTAVGSSIEDARDTVELFDQIAKDTIPWNNEPAIYRQSVSVLAPRNRDSLIITYRGSNLTESDPVLKFGGKIAERISLKVQEVQFKLDRTMLPPHGDDIEIGSGTIGLQSEQCKFWFVFCSKDRKELPTAILVLPEDLGNISVSYNTKQEERIYSENLFQKLNSHSTGDLTKDRCRKFNYSPHDPEYFIDISSITVYPYNVSCKPIRIFNTVINNGCKNGIQTLTGANGAAKHRWKQLDSSPAGFSVELCARSQIRKLKKVTGRQNLNLAWREYKTDDVVSEDISFNKEVALKWGVSEIFQLPNEAHAVTITINNFDGTTEKFIGNGDSQYSSVTFNRATSQLLVAPKNIDDIAELY